MTLFILLNLALCVTGNGGASRKSYSSIFSSFADVTFHTSSFLSTSFFHFIISQDDRKLMEDMVYRHFQSEVLRINDVITPEFQRHEIVLEQDSMEGKLRLLDQSEAAQCARDFVNFPEKYNKTLGQRGLELGKALDMLYDHLFMLTSAFLRILKLDRYMTSSVIKFLLEFNNYPNTKSRLIDETFNSFELCLNDGLSIYMKKFIKDMIEASKTETEYDLLKVLVSKEEDNLSKNLAMTTSFASYKRSLLGHLKYEHEEITKLYDLDRSFDSVKYKLYNYTFTGMMFRLLSFISKGLKHVFKYYEEPCVEEGDMTNVLVVLNKVRLMAMEAITSYYRNIYKYIFIVIINRFQLYQLNKTIEIGVIRNLIKENLKSVIKNIFKILRQKSIGAVIEVLKEISV
eukprot:GAHX01001149.1.p1 GENE.GAHX01001149.1~~GAHX01001149.1.p1  ORF type:complete len:401 (+),score=42.44 GAHX01001149.1:482-1684(+)